MTNRIHREIIGGHLLIIGGAEDKYNERRILRKFLSLAGDEKANILIIPVASDYPEFASDVYVQAFIRRRPPQCYDLWRVLHAVGRGRCVQDKGRRPKSIKGRRGANTVRLLQQF